MHSLIPFRHAISFPFLHLHSFISLPAFSAPQQAWLIHSSLQISPATIFCFFIADFATLQTLQLPFLDFLPCQRSNLFLPPFICVIHSSATPAFFPTPLHLSVPFSSEVFTPILILYSNNAQNTNLQISKMAIWQFDKMYNPNC